MQRDHFQPLTHTGLRSASTTGAPQGPGSQNHPHTLGGGHALSVSQPVSMQDLRMAGQSATGFQTQHFAGTPQDARPGPSGHTNPNQNAQNVAQGYYRNAQAAPGPVRSNSTSHAQYTPYPQPQYSNGYAQVISGHGHYPTPTHDARRSSMPSLNAGQSQNNQGPPMQISQNAQPSNSSGRQNASAGPSGWTQAPESPRQPRGPERNPTVMIPPQPAPASASAPSQPHFPQTSQASAPPPPRNALPTPPSTSAGPSNAQPVMLHSANQQARAILEPMRDAIANALSTAHLAFTEDLSKAHLLIAKTEARAREAQGYLSLMRDELARVSAERDRALEHCEQMKKEREAAMEEMKKMNENLPKLVVEHYQLKGDYDNLRKEVAALKETNAQLREKATFSLDHTQIIPPSLLQYSTDIPGVKLEFPAATSRGAKSVAVAQVKEESASIKHSSSPTDADADVAFALVRDFKVRRNKHRDQADPEQEHHRSISRQHPPPTSEAAAAPSFMRANPAPCDVPPTPPADQSPRSRRVSLGNPPVARAQSPPPTRIPNGAQSSDAAASARSPKHEDVEALQSMLLSSIPELGHMEVTGELDIIDLTTLDCEMTDSPANLTPGLPSPESEERKRTVEPEWNERQDTPNKRQRTAEAGEGPATQDAMVEGSNSPEFNEAFLRSLIEAAEADQTAVSPAPVPRADPAPRGDGQSTELSPILGAELGSKSNGNNDKGDQQPERGQDVPSVPQPATSRAAIPPTGLLTPPSPTPSTIPPSIPRPARPSELGSQRAPVVVAPVSAPSSAPALAPVAPASCSALEPTQASQQPPVLASPPPPPSIPAPLSRPLPASSSSSPSVPPPQPPPTRSISTTTTAKPLRPPLSVATSSSPRNPPALPSASPSAPPPQGPPVTPVVNALAGINLSLPSPTNAVQLPTEVPVMSPSKPEPPKKLGINHIDLIYRRVGSGYYLCRFCERRRKVVPGSPSTKFAANAPGYILTEHFEKEHPTSVQRFLDLTPEEIRESRQRAALMDLEDGPVAAKKRKSSG